MTEKQRKKLMALRTKAAQYPASVRAKLNALAGVNGSPTGRRPNVNNPMSPKPVQQMPGSLTVKYGMTPDDTMVSRAIEMSGGNPFLKQMNKLMEQIKRDDRVASSQVRQAAEGNALLDKVFAELRAQQEESRQANLGRYFEGHGRLGDVAGRINDRFTAGDAELRGVRDRTMAEIDNWGKAAEADTKEQLDLARGRILADMAARGMSNTNLPADFILDEEEKTARELARISEARSDRKIRADADRTNAIVNYGQDWSNADRTDTGNLVKFVQDRNDPMPDQNALLQLAMQYGKGGMGQGYGGVLTQAAQRGSQGGYGGGGVYGGGASLSPRAGLGMAAQLGASMFGGGYGGGYGYQQPAPVYSMPETVQAPTAPPVDKAAYWDARRSRARKINSAIRGRQAARKGLPFIF